MHGRFSLIADAANLSAEGKVNILGEFNVIYATAFPAQHPLLCYVASLEVGAGDVGPDHLAELRYVDADGNVVAPPILIKFEVTSNDQEEGETNPLPLIIPIHGLMMPGPGRYCIDLWCDGKLLTTCHFNGVLRPEPAAP